MENALPGKEAGEAVESGFGTKGTKASQSQAVLKLSFSEEQRFSTTSFGQQQNELEEPQEHLRATEIKGQVHSFPAEERVNIAVGNLPERSRESYLASCPDVHEDKDHRPHAKELEPESVVDAVEEQSRLSTEPGSMVSCEGGFEGPQRGSAAPLKPAPEAGATNTCGEAICQETTLGLIISKNADLNPEKTNQFYSAEQSQPGGLEFKANGVELKVEIQAKTFEHVCTDTPGLTHLEAHVADKDLAEVDQGPENKELVGKAEIEERSKQVTFLLEPDVLSEATLVESSAPMESTTRVSGENSEVGGVSGRRCTFNTWAQMEQTRAHAHFHKVTLILECLCFVVENHVHPFFVFVHRSELSPREEFCRHYRPDV